MRTIAKIKLSNPSTVINEKFIYCIKQKNAIALKDKKAQTKFTCQIYMLNNVEKIFLKIITIFLLIFKLIFFLNDFFEIK